MREIREKLDLIVGAGAIAAFTGLSIAQVYHQAARGFLPIKKQGTLLVASRSRLAAHFGAERVPLDPPPEAA